MTPASSELINEQVLVTPASSELINEQVLVTPTSSELINEQVLVTPASSVRRKWAARNRVYKNKSCLACDNAKGIAGFKTLIFSESAGDRIF